MRLPGVSETEFGPPCIRNPILLRGPCGLTNSLPTPHCPKDHIGIRFKNTLPIVEISISQCS